MNKKINDIARKTKEVVTTKMPSPTNLVLGACTGITAGAISAGIMKVLSGNKKASLIAGVSGGATAAIIMTRALQQADKDRQLNEILEDDLEAVYGEEATAEVSGDVEDFCIDVNAVMDTVNGETLRDFCGSFAGVNTALSIIPDAIRYYYEQVKKVEDRGQREELIEGDRVMMVRAWLTDFGTWKAMFNFIAHSESPVEGGPDLVDNLLRVAFNGEALQPEIVEAIQLLTSEDHLPEAEDNAAEDDGDTEA